MCGDSGYGMLQSFNFVAKLIEARGKATSSAKRGQFNFYMTRYATLINYTQLYIQNYEKSKRFESRMEIIFLFVLVDFFTERLRKKSPILNNSKF